MSDNYTDHEEHTLNTALVEAIQWLRQGLPNPVTNGEYIRRAFLESIVVVGGVGAGVDKEDIQSNTGITDKELKAIESEYIAKGIVKVEKNIFGGILYKLQYDTIEG